MKKIRGQLYGGKRKTILLFSILDEQTQSACTKTGVLSSAC